jgi:hypothetical protein
MQRTDHDGGVELSEELTRPLLSFEIRLHIVDVDAFHATRLDERLSPSARVDVSYKIEYGSDASPRVGIEETPIVTSRRHMD